MPDAEYRIKELERRLTEQEDLTAALLRNGLKDLKDRPGHLRFGGNVGLLHELGIQMVKTSNPAAGSRGFTALFWVPKFYTEPGFAPDRAYVDGLAVAGGDTIAALSSVSGSSAVDGTGGTIAGVFVTANNTTGDNYIRLRGATDILEGSAADPALFEDGMRWYRTDTDQFKGRRNGSSLNFLMTGDAAAEVSGMMKVSGSGYLVMPAAASGIDPANSGSAWTSGTWSELLASTSEADYIIGLLWSPESQTNFEAEIDIGTGAAASETVVSTIPVRAGSGDATPTYSSISPIMFPAPIAVATTTRVAVRVRSSSKTLEPANIKLIYVKQSELVAL